MKRKIRPEFKIFKAEKEIKGIGGKPSSGEEAVVV